MLHCLSYKLTQNAKVAYKVDFNDGAKFGFYTFSKWDDWDDLGRKLKDPSDALRPEV